MRGGGGGSSQDGVTVEDFLLGYVRPFDEPRIRAYLAKVVGKEKVGATIEAMGRIYNLLELGTRPFLLSLIAPRLEALAKRSQAGEIIGAGTLYEQLVDEWIARDTGKHFIPPQEKPTIMGMLAHDLWRQGLTQIHHKKLGRWVTGEVRSFLMEIGWISGNHDDADRSEADVRTAMFLVRDEEGNFSFAHRSFGEFFLARYLLAEIIARGPAILNLPALSREVADFFLDLLGVPEFVADRARVATVISQTLAGPYQPGISENAFSGKRNNDDGGRRFECFGFSGGQGCEF